MMEVNDHKVGFVESDTELKTWLVEYVGNKLARENNVVTVEMIVEAVTDEFPEFIFALAEENFFRGYEQALVDIKSTRDE
jgi:hypothetical protein